MSLNLKNLFFYLTVSLNFLLLAYFNVLSFYQNHGFGPILFS